MRLLIAAIFLWLFFMAFAVQSLADGRWRDARESGIPAIVLTGCVVLASLHVRRERRRSRDRE